MSRSTRNGDIEIGKAKLTKTEFAKVFEVVPAVPPITNAVLAVDEVPNTWVESFFTLVDEMAVETLAAVSNPRE